MEEIIREVWDRFQIIGRIVGDYVARFFATLFYYVVLIPFALIAKQADPLDARVATPIWRTRKPVGNSLDDARSQS
ncbi:MAG: hypothetical protein KF716_22915 [Anaerolineae bacterium]|nr:hypothetical protein [Anaerolineae bacterium]